MFGKEVRLMSRRLSKTDTGSTVTIKKAFDVTMGVRRLMLTINLDRRLVLSLAEF